MVVDELSIDDSARGDQPASDPLPLARRQDAHGAEPGSTKLTRARAQADRAVEGVPDDTRIAGGDERQQHRAVGTQPLDQTSFVGSAERFRDDLADAEDVLRGLRSYAECRRDVSPPRAARHAPPPPPRRGRR
jgi:hypothetical protein